MTLATQPTPKSHTPKAHVDPVLAELWRVKDARAAKFGDTAGLMRHLREKYGRKPHWADRSQEVGVTPALV
jgi:hypothetical protein